ncbi:hypothetical protein EJB05_13263, partial [Eragrostis curvula]
MKVRNPNWAIGIKHDEALMAAYSFDDQQFDRVQVADKGKKQAARKTVVYRLVTNSDGRSIALGNAGEAEFKKQNATGDFEVEVKLTGKFKYTLRKAKCEFAATCPLKIKLAQPGESVVFQKVDCKVEKNDDKYLKSASVVVVGGGGVVLMRERGKELRDVIRRGVVARGRGVPRARKLPGSTGCQRVTEGLAVYVALSRQPPA